MDEDKTDVVLTGRCLCGAVKFAATGVETRYHACHCSMCRRWAGGPVLAADVASVSFQGEEMLVRYVSSEWAERGFCRQCGSHLFYFLKPANLYMMSVGAFDDPSTFSLVREIYIDHKPEGYAFDGASQKLTEKQVLASFGIG